MDRETVRLVVGMIFAATLAACGGGGAGEGGAGSSDPFPHQTAYITRPQNCSSASNHFARLVIVGAEETDYCVHAPDPRTMPNDGCPPREGEKVAMLAYIQADLTGGDVAPIGPGTYTDRDMWITGMIGDGSPSGCPNTDGTGSITLTTVNESVVRGSYDLTIDGEHYRGTIDAPVCWYGDEVCGD